MSKATRLQLDLEVALPEVPGRADACAGLIAELSGRPGVENRNQSAHHQSVRIHESPPDLTAAFIRAASQRAVMTNGCEQPSIRRSIS